MTMRIHVQSRAARLGLAICTGMLTMAGVTAGHAATAPVVGSRNVAMAEPTVPRPGTTPCVVTLFSNQSFGKKGGNTRMDAIPTPFHYAPPAGCKGDWAKVVLVADFSVDQGRQYDRTASFWLDGTNIYFGTTQEPWPDLSPSWEIQRDLTDYSKLFETAGSGVALINNWIDETHTSPIRVTAKLLFYPADKQYPAPAVPSEVYSLNGNKALPANLTAGAATVSTEGHAEQTADLPNQMQALQRSLTFPRNTSRVYVDVVAQPQFRDEFYYQCLPNTLRSRTAGFADRHAYTKSSKPQACGGGNFREVLVSVDGEPAGLAPITPWVYTGGIDPFLWRPTPANETLNFLPYRVDLSPFAGVLSDGRAHDVSIRVVGVNNFFAVAGTVLVYRDAAVEHTGGGIVANSLKDLSLEPTVTSTLGSDPAKGVNGAVATTASQHYRIEGYVNGPKGRITNTVTGDMDIANRQQFATAMDTGSFRHVTNQDVEMKATSERTGGSVPDENLQTTTRYGLSVDTSMRNSGAQGDDNGRAVTIHQRFDRRVLQDVAGQPLFQAHMTSSHVGSDAISFDRGKPMPFHSNGQTSEQSFAYWNSLGDCYFDQVRARDGAVTGSTQGTGCLGGGNSLHWFVHPDGSADGFGWRAQ